MSDIHQLSDQEIHKLINLEAEKYDGWMVCGCKCASGKAGEFVGLIPMCCVFLNALECDCGKDDAYYILFTDKPLKQKAERLI